MEEVVFRRYRRLIEENIDLPQLIVIDGGKGQLNAAVKSLETLGIRGRLAIIGIAKKLEEIYFPGDSVPLYLDKQSSSLKLIQRIRNEAHRFGVEFHRRKRSGDQTRSLLEEVPGIGPRTIQTLFSTFKTLEGIKKQNLETLASLIGKKRAEQLLGFFNRNSSDNSERATSA
jgi:excinuclease ABC subunit C